MRSPLNSPVEVGVRVLMILTEVYPENLDVNRLVLLDHSVLHSADLGGPTSPHPALPIRAGELGVKRAVIEQGLQVMLRAGLVEMSAAESGIRFQASDSAYSFVSILGAEHARLLRDRTRWVVQHFGDLSETTLRTQMRTIFTGWSEEFDTAESRIRDGDSTR
jgi:hypothetical protein